MSTPLTDSINALTTYANEVTGGSDTTLSDAVHTLASGYGGGDSSTVIVDDNTRYFRFDSTDPTRMFARLFGYKPIEVVYLGGFTDFSPMGYMFEFMPNLKAVILPDATILAAYMFWDYIRDHSIPTIDLYQKQAFASATPFKLEQGGNVILRNTEMSTTGFNASTWGMANGVKFYVPQALLQDYLADTNWGTFGSDRILPIEGSPYEDIDWWKALI